MSEHTPGPWYKSNTKLGGMIYSNSRTVNIAEVFNLSGFAPVGEDDANARLIAAAPELLQALENLFQRCIDLNNDEEIDELDDLDEARKAIQKARE